MKRGLIAWDKQELPSEVFSERVQRVRDYLAEEGLSALAIYSDLWRSNDARFFSNYMPYFNRALLVLPADGPPTLLCGLSPRVYSWIRSVTTIEDIRPAGSFVRALLQLVSERNWKRIGYLDFEQFPYDLYQALRSESVPAVPVDSSRVYSAARDPSELAMRRKAAVLARRILAEEMPKSVGSSDRDLVSRLESRFRGSGAEDLIILMTNGDGPPSPPVGDALVEHFSISLAVEYRGHWIRLSRPNGPGDLLRRCKNAFDEVLVNKPANGAVFEHLGSAYPYEWIDGARLSPPSIVAVHVQHEYGGKRLFYGETCIYEAAGFKTL